MSPALLTLLIALGASAYLALHHETRMFGVVGLVVAAVHVAISLGWLSLRISGVDLALVLAIGVLVAGGGAWFRSKGKPEVTAATAVALVGLSQLSAHL